MSIEKFKDILGSPRNFLEEEIEEDIRAGKVPSDIYTRFPMVVRQIFASMIPILQPRRQDM